MAVDHWLKPSLLGHVETLFRRASLGWWLGCLTIIIPSALLLTEWCHSCQTQSLTQTTILPSIGIVFGSVLLVSRLTSFSPVWQIRLVRAANLLLVVAGLIAVLALGLMLLGYHECPLCLTIWTGVTFLFLMELPEQSIFSFARLIWAVALLLLATDWLHPIANLEAKRILVGLGVHEPSTDNGLAVGSQVPATPKLPLNASVLFWTHCPCPLFNVQKALTALRQQGQIPIIVCLARVSEMNKWAPNSPVYVVNTETFQQWNVSPSLPHFVLSIRDGLVTANRSVNAMERK